MNDRSTTSRSPALERGFGAFAPAEDARLRLRPLGMLTGAAAARAVEEGAALALLGGPRAFLRVEAAARGRSGKALVAAGTPAELRRWVGARVDWRVRVEEGLERLGRQRAPWAGLSFDRARLMGVINVTPDSFSDGGKFLDPERAIVHGRAMLEAGVDILDVGGESTRPGADPVPPEEELSRVLPVVRALAATGVPVSIDTRRASVMAAALEAGARVINDVTALAGDPESLGVAARSGADVLLMHMAGDPTTMQRDPRYGDVVLDVLEYLEGRIAACAGVGIPPARVAVDPGIGFGKTLDHNLALLARLGILHGLGGALAVGVSRKSLIAGASRGEPPEARLPGSLAAALAAVSEGAQILRVHDVAETRQALAVRDRIEAFG